MPIRPFPATMPRVVQLAAVACLLCVGRLPAANVDYTSLAGLKAQGFQKFLDDARDQGYEPVYINGYDVGDHAEYAGVAIKDPDKKPFESKFDMTNDELKDYWKEMMKKDFRPTNICSYHTKEGPRFAAVWVTTKFDMKLLGGTQYWRSKFEQEAKNYNDTVKAMHKDGFVPINVTAYQGPDGAVRYSSLFYKLTYEVETKIAMSGDQYQKQLDLWKDNGFRILRVHAYDSPDGLRFLATARQYDGDKKSVWEEHHDMTGDQYQKQFDRLGGEGFRPGCICGYRDGGQVKFAVIWSKEK